MEKDRFIKFSALLNSADKSIARIKHKKMGSYGLSNAHTSCIRLLADNPGGLTKTELALICGVDKAQISRVVASLEKNNYVNKPSEERGYKQKYALTEEGQKVADEITCMILEINNYVSGDISKEELQTFYKTFALICDNLKKAEELF